MNQPSSKLPCLVSKKSYKNDPRLHFNFPSRLMKRKRIKYYKLNNMNDGCLIKRKGSHIACNAILLFSIKTTTFTGR